MSKAIKKSKFILAMTLVAFISVAIIGTSIFAYAKGKSNKASFAEGDDIAFGTLDGHILNWTILSYDDSTKQALIISRTTLSSASITSYREAIDINYRSTGTKAGYVKWSENYWRGWLNQSFYENSFTPEEKAKIQKTTLSDADAKESLMNFYHDTTLDADYINRQTKNSLNQNIYNTQTTTSDNIFFLSTDEYTEYKDRIKYETSIPYSWPLRTNSYDDPAYGLYVNEATKLIEKKYFYTGTGIRPCMYVKLDKTDEEKKAEEGQNSGDANSGTNTGAANTNNGTNTAAGNSTGTNQSTNSNATNTNTANTNTANNTTNNTNNQNNANGANAANNQNNANANNAGANNQNANGTANTSAAAQTGANNNANQTRQAAEKRAIKTRSYANNGTQVGSIFLPYDASYSMVNGSTAQVAIDLEYLNFTDKQYTVTYKSSDAAVFTVDSNGQITSAGKGTAVLSVRMKKSNGKVYSMECVISVT